jgi:hypothetical protein
MGDRWPPVYDAEDLKQQIKDLVSRSDFEKSFFDGAMPTGRPCQGDIVRLQTGLPVLHEDGQPGVYGDGDLDYWLVIGNTCDFERPCTGPSLSSVPWTQVVPLVNLGDVGVNDRAMLRGYQYSRRFYVPQWSPSLAGLDYVADFLTPVALHKRAFEGAAEVQVRLSFPAWVLLHSCLIRFFCRDDGRFDT